MIFIFIWVKVEQTATFQIVVKFVLFKVLDVIQKERIHVDSTKPFKVNFSKSFVVWFKSDQDISFVIQIEIKLQFSEVFKFI